MRKSILAGWLCLSITAILLFSCQKELTLQQDIAISNNDNNSVIQKVNDWLDNSKSVKQPNKAANIDLLKSNLDFSAMRVEKSGQGEKLITVPVKEDFKTIKKVDKKVTPYLLLTLGNTGSIKKGNLVLYTPKEGEVSNKMPDDAFNKIFNNDEPDCSGKFLFLSVTGRQLFQLEYNDGNLKSYSHITTERENQATVSSQVQTNSSCIDWYWVTTYRDQFGNILSQTWEYVGTTCEGCDDPNWEMVCPDSGNGSGGGGDIVLSPNENLDGLDNICKSSFKFQTTVQPGNGSGGWRVAGTTNINMQLFNTGTGQYVPLILPTIYFGLPIIRANGEYYSENIAKEKAAEAVDYAEGKVLEYLNSNGGTLDMVTLEQYYRQKINQKMQEFGGSATLSPGSNVTIVNLGTASYGWPIIGCL